MKSSFIPLAIVAAVSFGAVNVASAADRAPPISTTQNSDDGTRTLNTPAGSLTTQSGKNGTAGVGSDLGTAKSPKVKANAAVHRADKDKGTSPSADLNAGVSGPNDTDQRSTGEKLTGQSAK